MVLTKEFYLQKNVVEVSRQLLGKVLYTRIDGIVSAGIIIETEAYAGITDKASHAYGDKRSRRTGVMYQEGGCAYIYLIYGMYSLFNVVTNKAGVPHAILVRSIVPYQGLEIMQQRRNDKALSLKEGIGPGRLSRLLGINYKMTGISLAKSDEGDSIWIEDNGIDVLENKIQIGMRVGIEYAKEDAELLYRFWVEPNLLIF